MINVLLATEEAGYQIKTLENYVTQEQLCEAVKDIDAMIVRSDIVDSKVLACAAKLKIVVRAGAGYDNIDIDAASEKGIVVMNTPGQNSNAVAELAIGLAIFGIRGMFGGASGGELRGRTIGLHGYGYVARNVKRIARGFGMNPIVYTRFSKAQAISEGLMVTDSLEELYAMSDVVSIHVPARDEHIGSVSYDVLKHVKKNAIIVNTARKEVVNEGDMLRFLHERPDVRYLSTLPHNASENEKTLKGRFFSPQKK
jgi:D-3-phosphoglycerate dehydrogenase